MTDHVMATATKPAPVMLLSTRADHWITAVAAEQYDYYPVQNAAEAVHTLQNIRYDLILIDDPSFKKEAARVVNEIKRRNPTVPVIIVTDEPDETRQEQLYRAGADDFLTRAMSNLDLIHHLELMIKQHRQNRTLAQRTQNLHAMASLSRLLYNAQDHHTLLMDAVQLLCNTFHLYGVVFALREGDVLHIYAGGSDTLERQRLYESIVRFDRYDPFCWSMENRITQVYQNIRENPNFTTVPVLPDIESMIVQPLVFQDDTLGSMGICAQPGVVLTHEDLIVFEPFAAQFVVALQKVALYRQQYVNVQSSRHLLKAWEQFANLSAPHQVATVLRELVEEVPHAGQALVWFFDNPYAMTSETPLVDCANEEAYTAFHEIYSGGVIARMLEQTNESGFPTIYDGRSVETGPLLPLFHSLYSPQVLFVPITTSDVMIGGLFAGSRVGTQFTQEDIDLMANLVRTAGQMFERILLNSTIWEKSARLEAILRTISEGIFFVDENDRIGFCNPQFSEMTGVQPSEALQQPADGLLRLLASRSDDPQRVISQLQAAQQIVSRPNVIGEDYPIVDLILPDADRRLHIEFVKIEGLDTASLTWAGLIRDQAPSQQNEAARGLLQDVIADHLRMPYAQVRTQVGVLAEQHGAFSQRERDRLLHEMESSLDRFGQVWLNFLDLSTLELGGVMVQRQPVDVVDVVRRVLNNRVFLAYSRLIRVDLRGEAPSIRGDEYRLERALSNVLYVALTQIAADNHTTLRVQQRDSEVSVMLDRLPEALAAEFVTLMSGPRQGNGQIHPNSFALYVSQELLSRQGGRLYMERGENGEYRVVMGLPLAGALPQIPLPQIPAPAAGGGQAAAPGPIHRPPATVGISAPQRQMKTVMVVEGRSTLVRELRERLESMDYDVLVYDQPEEALRDVNATRLDLLVIDASLRDMSGIDLCAKVRGRSQVPTILMADKTSETERVRGLNVGADDYIARPISMEEMLAKVNIIFRRGEMIERTREPLQVAELYMDFGRREVFLAGKPLELTRIEYDLLHYLVTNRGQVLTHKQLLEKVWGPEYENETQYLWVNISRLRKKLEPRADSPRYIQNQLGIGYMFAEP
jgi:DNA-binding response OmpR family regulator/PAS domain-containing protein